MDVGLCVLVVFLIPMINGLPSNTYYLIDIANNTSSNESFCSTPLINDQFYRIPQACQHHLLCDPYSCDDQSFRCVKIRESLCCLQNYLQQHCERENFLRTKDLFRSVYFHVSIEHGYCEINLERIEKSDQAYCLGNNQEATTTTISSSTRSTFKHFHRRLSTIRPPRNRHRLANRQNYSSLANLDYLRQVTIVEANLLSSAPRKFAGFSSVTVVLFSWFI